MNSSVNYLRKLQQKAKESSSKLTWKLIYEIVCEMHSDLDKEPNKMEKHPTLKPQFIKEGYTGKNLPIFDKFSEMTFTVLYTILLIISFPICFPFYLLGLLYTKFFIVNNTTTTAFATPIAVQDDGLMWLCILCAFGQGIYTVIACIEAVEEYYTERDKKGQLT